MKRIGVAILVVAAAGLLVPTVVYLERGPIGIRLATQYLKRRGVPAVIRLDRLDWRGASGSAVLGRFAQPDLTVDHFDISFSAPALFRGHPAAPRVLAIHVYRPHLAARWRQGRLNFGALQPLIDDAMAKPGGGPGPDIAVDDGELRLTTSAGLVRLAGDGRLTRGRLTSARLSLRPVDLAASGYAAEGLMGDAVLQAKELDRLQVRLHLSAAAAHDQMASARGVDIATTFDLPYATGESVLQGRLSGQGRLTADSLKRQGGRLNQAVVDLHFNGALAKTPNGAQFVGPVSISMGAATGDQASAFVASPNLQASSPALGVTIKGKAVSVAGSYVARLTADHGHSEVQRRTLQLLRLDTRGAGRIDLTPGITNLSFRGSASLQGGFSIADAQALARAPGAQTARGSLQATLARNLRSFHLQIPAVMVGSSANRLVLELSRPMTLTFAEGVVVQAFAEPGSPLLLADSPSWSGGLQARLDGPGLPSLGVMGGHFRASSHSGDVALQARATLQAEGSLGGIQGASLLAPVTIDLRKAVLMIIADRCETFALKAYRLGPKSELRSAQGQLCPDAAPLLKLSSSSWAVAARFQGLAGELPAAGLDLKAGEASVILGGGGSRQPAGRFKLATALIADTHSATETRFRPLRTTGTLDLADQMVSGQVLVSLADMPQAQARITLHHDLVHAQGGADGSVLLQFQPKALQPESLSPAFVGLASQAKGSLAFNGHFGWRDGRLSSEGRVSTSGLDFRSPAGQITGLRGDLAFSSLAPLILQPAQIVTANGLQTLLPLTALSATFGLTPTALTLVTASATVAKGRASLGPIVLPLSSGAIRPTISDTLTLKSVDFQDLISSLNLGKAVTIQARISGAAPFTVGPAGIRITDGRLSADGPGRLSIRREALNSAVATGGAAGAQPNAVQDFAYQALENLAFDQLDAAVASRAQGRLGVVLHVRGRHDPPTDPPSRIGLLDLLRGHAFDKPIPLPKATPVDLTLDTSLNFDELVEAYAGLNSATRAKGGGSVAVLP